MWQEVRNDLHPHGIEIVTVALDADPDAARPFIEAAHAEHPSLVDRTHVLDARFGVVNVPNGIWIDEAGMIVRPAEPAFPGRNPVNESFRTIDITTLPEDVADMLREARKITTDPEGYLAMLHDWAEHGEQSRYVLAPDEVVRRSARRSIDESLGAAEFELGEHLHRHGNHAAAVAHWRNAHRLQPDNWTYRRQAWNFEDPVRQGPNDAYDSCWIQDVKRVGAENYYPPVVP